MARSTKQAVEYLLLIQKSGGGAAVDGFTGEIKLESMDGFTHTMDYSTGLLKGYEKVTIPLEIYIPFAGINGES